MARVNKIGERVRTELKAMGYDIGPDQTPIIPIVMGDEMKALMAWKTLYEAGVYTDVALPHPSRPAMRCCGRGTWPPTPTSRSTASWRRSSRSRALSEP